ncbi:VWA domain-containing protein [Actinacidiphila glaucinigra]|uniref:VWA domain-containing protein n=1 Tax=Actinacidiphila glaucinigra TaxID=235986 RepID=UPI0032488AAC
MRVTRKGIYSASVAARISGTKRHSTRVVLALPGAHRHPFETGLIADMARRVATLGDFLAPGAGVDAWMYTSQTHRLPELRLSQAAGWIADWAVLPREPLLSQDAARGNLLTQHTARYELFGPEDAAEAIRGIMRSLPENEGPTLVLFFIWGFHSDGPYMADELEGASGENVFWQFVGDTGTGSSVLDHLDRLRAEAPHISNVNLYQGWDSIQDTPDYLFFRGVLKPFVRWRKALPQMRS